MHRTGERQEHGWSTQRVFEGMNLRETSQPRYVLFPAMFSCLGAGWRSHCGGVFPDEYDGKEGPGSWYMQGADYNDRSLNQSWVRREGWM